VKFRINDFTDKLSVSLSECHRFLSTLSIR